MAHVHSDLYNLKNMIYVIGEITVYMHKLIAKLYLGHRGNSYIDPSFLYWILEGMAKAPKEQFHLGLLI